jgi:large repetitive protein
MFIMKNTLHLRISKLLLIIFLLLTGYSGFAQYTATSLETGRYYSAVARDKTNNIYVARLNTTTDKYEIAKYINGNPASVQVIASGFPYSGGADDGFPLGIAVNSHGDVFVTGSITDGSNGTIYRLKASSNYAKEVIQVGNFYSAITVDAADNVLTMEYDAVSNNYVVMRYTAGNEQLAGTLLYDGLTLGASANYPWGIVTDSHNNIYFLDFLDNGGAIHKLTAPAFTHTQVASGRLFTSLAIDSSNNIYTNESLDGTTWRVMRYADPATTGTQVYSGLSSSPPAFPRGLAINSRGQLYVCDIAAAGGGRFLQLDAPPIAVSSVTQLDATPINANQVRYNVTFSAPAFNVTSSAFTITKTGTITGQGIDSVTGSGTSYTVYVKTGSGNGNVQLGVTAAGISPAVTNAGYTAQRYLIDRLPPFGSVSINSGADYTKSTTLSLINVASDASTVNMSFSEDTITWTTPEPFANSKVFTVSAGEGKKTVYMRVVDAAGNSATYSDTVIVDQTDPVLSITSKPAANTKGTSGTFEFSANEPVTFEGNLDGSGWITVTSPFSFTGLADGNHTFNVIATDRANNVSTNVLYTWKVDNAEPDVDFAGSPDSIYHNVGDGIFFTVHFDEPIVVTSEPSLHIKLPSGPTSATYISEYTTSNSITFLYVVKAGDDALDGIELVGGQFSGVTDLAGNVSQGVLHVAKLNNVIINTIRPSVVVSTSAPFLTNTPVVVRIDFSEAVTGFEATDLFLTGAALQSDLTKIDDSTYTVMVTPLGDGVVQASVSPGVALSTARNPNTQSNYIQFVYDHTSPVVSSVTVSPDGIYHTGDEISFIVTFSEEIDVDTTGGAPHLNITVGSTTVRALLTDTSGNDITFTYKVKDGDNDMNGITVNNLALNGAIIRDLAFNPANLTLNSVSSTANVNVNTMKPAVAITTTAGARVNAPFTATVTFSEAVTGLIAADFDVVNATVSNVQATSTSVYTVLITPAAEGAVRVFLPADAAINSGNNGNLVSNTLTETYDITAPVVNSVTVPADGHYNAGTVLNFDVVVSEEPVVTGTPLLNLTIGTTSVNAAYVSTTGKSMRFSYTVVDGNNGGITVNSLSGTIRDSATNALVLTLHSIGNTGNVLVNTQHPTVSGTTTVSRVNNAFTMTFTFSEAVSGFAAGDVTAINGTVSDVQTTDNITYTALVTPTAEGQVTVYILDNVALNIAGNGNQLSDTTKVFYDITAPAVSSVTVPAAGYYKAGQQLSFAVKFTEDVIVTGTPVLNLTIGTTTVQATYTTTAANQVNFTYTVLAGQMDADGIDIGALTGTIKDVAGNNAVLTLNSVPSTSGVRVNTATPTVILTSDAAARLNTTFSVKLFFSEPVTGLLAEALAVGNGTASNLVTSDNVMFTVDITPSADGDVIVWVPALVASNNAGTMNATSAKLSRVYDATAPVINAGQTFNVSEKAGQGTVVGMVLAFEAVGTMQNWTISGDGTFAITSNGAITVADPALLAAKVNTTVLVPVTVSDGLNTSVATNISINVKLVNQAPVLDAISDVALCTDVTSHTIQLSGASAVETDQTYTLSVSANQPVFDVLSVDHAGLLTYKLKAGATGATVVIVTIKDDGGVANDGVDSSRQSFILTANALPHVEITSDKGTTISKGDVVTLTATGGNSYTWNDGTTGSLLEARPAEATTYTVTVKNTENCISDASVTIKVVEDYKVDAVNIMTPNGDGKNDKWVIQNIDLYKNNEVRIYDRSGRLVYSKRNYNNEWDATMNGSPLAEGTYYYVLTFEGGKTAKGFITIIRDRK